MNESTRSWMLSGLLTWAVSLPAIAGSDVPALEARTKTDHVAARMVPELSAVAPGQRLSMLLQQRIIPGWHTYWLNPGDSGQPTQIKWHLPDAAQAGPIQWPVPMRIPMGPLVNYGYADEVALISDIAVPGNWPAGRPFPIRADVSWLVCADVCIPESGSFSLSIPTGATSAYDAARPLFAAARAAQPVASPWRTSISGRNAQVVLHLALPASEASRIVAAQFFPAEWGLIDHAAQQQFARAGDGLTITVAKGDLPTPAAASGIVVLTEGSGTTTLRKAISFSTGSAPTATGLASAATSPAPMGTGPVPTGTGPASIASGSAPTGADPAVTASTNTPSRSMPIALIAIALPALIGGLLLNLMPCVFPVLAMKALALVGHAQEPPRNRIVGGVAYTAGVLVSFAILGGVLLALKAGGSTVGWGFQLQSPAFVALLSYILLVAGLSLSGLFEMGGGLMGVGSELVARGYSARGSFFTGALAAVVATPCTAPFMATALGAALTQSAPIAMATFLVLGFGLALPYLVLTFVPAFARMLPRPGRWMNTLKQSLAFPLYASAAWLVWVLAQQTSADGVFAVLLGMVAIAFAIWLWRLEIGGQFARAARATVCLAVVLGSVALAVTVTAPQVRSTASLTASDLSEPFTRDRLDRLRGSGKPVFVNLTAAWCITCKVNERLALSGEAFRSALKAGGFTYLKGDWTRGDPEITRLLESFGRQGVPLYLVFPPRGQAVVLPQMLTESIVVEALKTSAPTSITLLGETQCDPRLSQHAKRCS